MDYLVAIKNKNDGRQGYFAEGRVEEAVSKERATKLRLESAENIIEQFNNRFSYWEAKLEKIENNQENKESQMFKVGDKVRVLDSCPYTPHRGKIGTIDTVSNNEVGLTYSGYKDGPIFSSKYVEHYKEEIKPKTTNTSVKWIRANSGTFTIVVDNKSYTVPKDHLNYAKIDKAVKTGDFSNIQELVDAKEDLTKFTAKVGNVEIKDGILFRNGNPLHNTIANRIIDLYKGGYPVDAMVKFLDNLMQNPSKRAVDELYLFLEHKGLPITEDGHFLAYKRVTKDFKDLHTKKLDNSVGKTVEMPRNEVCDDPNKGCHFGLHAGSLEYVKSFSPGNPVVIVKINPYDVICIPYEDHKKLRCSKYVVVGEYDQNLDDYLEDKLYDKNGCLIESDYEEDEWDDESW